MFHQGLRAFRRPCHSIGKVRLARPFETQHSSSGQGESFFCGTGNGHKSAVGVPSRLQFALDGLRFILVFAFAYAITADFCVLMIFWSCLLTYDLGPSFSLSLSPLFLFLALITFLFPLFFYVCRLDFLCEWTNGENLLLGISGLRRGFQFSFHVSW